ncbi:MAG: phosphoglycerate mutase family protein [Patescibacteria group bacterium]|nr:phosphoglycerate mutase family protein [Patescibacteria group bacterium]
MNHLVALKKINNRYFILRHGQSQANVAGIILSHPQNGLKGYGLTKGGKLQVEKSIRTNKVLDTHTEIYSSDFIRAKETAQIVRRHLGAKAITYTVRLRERNFGGWEKTSDKNYHHVWLEDAKNSHHQLKGVESVAQVVNRVTKLILKLENKFKNKKILLVAHGDTLQILQTAFLNACPSTHRQVKHLEVAEIRELKLIKT